MKQAFIYTDDKSQKFWIIDSAGNDIMVNFGKLGTNGRFQITEYGDEAECQKAADKLIMRKTKKGYKPAPRKQNRSLSNQQSHHRHRLRQHHNFR